MHRAQLLALVLVLAACRKGGGAEKAGPVAPGGEGSKEEVATIDRVGVVGEDGDLPVSAAQVRAGIPHLRFAIDIGDAPARGPGNAPVTIVMFSDFECPYCGRGLEIVRQLEAEYEGQIRFVYKAFPIDRHPNALRAALVAHAAQDAGKFWEFHDLLFSGKGLDADVIDGYAAQVGLDPAKVQDDLESLAHAPAVNRDIRQAKRFDIRSTPAFFVNGRHIKGAKPIEAFRHMVDQELSLVRKLESEGVQDHYAHLTRHAYTSIVYEGERTELDEGLVYPVPLGDSPRLGPDDAPLTVVVFADFQCGYCAYGNQTIEALRERYGDEMRIVFKHFPLPGHARGVIAARGSYFALEQGKFWEYHDEVYALEARIDTPSLEAIARKLGFDEAGFAAALQSERHDEGIKRDIQLGGSLGVGGTPTYFVNGRPLSGARSVLDFRMLFVEELERAQALRNKGVAGERLYEVLAGLSDGP